MEADIRYVGIRYGRYYEQGWDSIQVPSQQTLICS